MDRTAAQTMGYELTKDGKKVSSEGSPEYRVFKKVPAGGIAQPALKDACGDDFKIGFSQGMKNKWFSMVSARTHVLSVQPAHVFVTITGLLTSEGRLCTALLCAAESGRRRPGSCHSERGVSLLCFRTRRRSSSRRAARASRTPPRSCSPRLRLATLRARRRRRPLAAGS